VSDEDALVRVRFYGTGDLALGLHIPRVAELVEAFDPGSAPTDTTDILELHNVQKYLEQGLLPRDYPDEQRTRALEKIPRFAALSHAIFQRSPQRAYQRVSLVSTTSTTAISLTYWEEIRLSSAATGRR
jgi:hypothetical protein